MKTYRSARLSIALSLLAVTAALCAKEKTDAVPPPSVQAMSGTADSSPAPQALASSGTTDNSSAEWADIKECTYGMRALFFAGLKRLEAKVDAEITELKAKRAEMDGTTDTKEWDFSMKEMTDARSYLKSMGEESTRANVETWSQAKEKVGAAWVRTQDAFAKVKSSTTN